MDARAYLFFVFNQLLERNLGRGCGDAVYRATGRIQSLKRLTNALSRVAL